ncbi:MAG: hypothetical protein WD334_12140 [Chitinophagales bacterium]
MPKFLILSLLIYLCCVLHTQAQDTHFSVHCKLAYQALLDLDFEELELQLANEIKQNPENLFVPYLRHYGLFVKYYVQPGSIKFETLSARLEKNKSLIQQNNTANGYWRDYFNAETQLQEALIQLNEQNYLSGFFQLRSAYLFSKEVVDRAIIAHPAEKTLAICEAIFSAAPSQYQWILMLLSIDADLPKAEEKLRRLAQNPLFYFRKECNMLSAALELHLGGNAEKAYALLKDEQNSQPPLFYTYLLANSANYAGQNDTALALLKNISFEEYQRFPMLFLLRGKLYLQKLDSAAELWLRYFLDYNKGENFVKSALHYLSWNALIHNNLKDFGSYQQAVLNRGAESNETDRAAQKAALEAVIPDVELLKARLLFDGGYYQQALDILKPENKNISTEKQYRLGRIYHALEHTETALFYYEKVIAASKKEGSYLPANSAYLTGKIFLEKKDYDRAKIYFEKVFEYEDHAYKLSLDHKAKNALRQLKQVNRE